MFNKLFEKNEKTVSNSVPEKKVFGPTKKRKNTYTIKYSAFRDPCLWEWCSETPLYAAVINGQPQKNEGFCVELTQFPNPGAYYMAEQRHTLPQIMGEKMATTIIEYLDKETNKPVATIFPTYVHIHDGYEKDFNKHLNHATRKDLEYQILIRRKAFENAKQR